MTGLHPLVGSGLSYAVTWLLTYLLHSTLLIGGVWLAVRWLPVRSPIMRDTLWKVALLGGIASATWQTVGTVQPLGGRIAVLQPVSVVPAEPGEPAPPAAAEKSAQTYPTTPIEPSTARAEGREARESTSRRPPAPVTARRVTSVISTTRAAPLPVSATGMPARPSARQSVQPAVAASVNGAPRTRLAAAERTTEAIGRAVHLAISSTLRSWGTMAADRSRLPALLVGLWLIGTISGLSRLALSLVRMRQLLAGRRSVADLDALHRLARLATRARLQRPIRLTTSTALRGPIALGSSEICVPERVLSQLSAEEQETVLAHEMAHLVRRDPLWLILVRLCQVVLFFQPLNRVAADAIRETAEFLCDDWAVQRTGGDLTLARCLVEVAGWVDGNEHRQPVTAMADSRSSTLLQRIQRLLGDTDRQQKAPRRARVPIAIALLLIVGLLAPTVSALRHHTARGPRADVRLAVPNLSVPLTRRTTPAPASTPMALPVPSPAAPAATAPQSLSFTRGDGRIVIGLEPSRGDAQVMLSWLHDGDSEEHAHDHGYEYEYEYEYEFDGQPAYAPTLAVSESPQELEILREALESYVDPLVESTLDDAEKLGEEAFEDAVQSAWLTDDEESLEELADAFDEALDDELHLLEDELERRFAAVLRHVARQHHAASLLAGLDGEDDTEILFAGSSSRLDDLANAYETRLESSLEHVVHEWAADLERDLAASVDAWADAR